MFTEKVFGHLSLILVMTIFGLTFIAIKIALRELRPFTIAFLRFLLASIFLFLLVRFRYTNINTPLPWLKLILMGLSGVTGFFILQNLGLTLTTASNASLILASIPAITAILAAGFLKEKITLFKTIGICLAILGIFLIILAGNSELKLTGSFLGELLILGSAFGWAIYTITSRSIKLNVPHIIITAYSIFIGTLFLIPFFVYEYQTYGFNFFSFETWMALIFLGVFASGLAFLLYNYALTKLEAGKAAIYVNLSPVVTILAGKYYLGENLGILEILGGVIILSGIFITGWEKGKGPKKN